MIGIISKSIESTGAPRFRGDGFISRKLPRRKEVFDE